jgi:hypothetical protein
MSNFYLVAGNLRSGTSLTVHICNKLGLYTGESNYADEFNSQGYWEDMHLPNYFGNCLNRNDDLFQMTKLEEIPEDKKQSFLDFYYFKKNLAGDGNSMCFKILHSIFAPEAIMDFVPDPLSIIVPRRDVQNSILSFKRMAQAKNFPLTEDQIEKKINSNNDALLYSLDVWKKANLNIFEFNFDDPKTQITKLADFFECIIERWCC